MDEGERKVNDLITEDQLDMLLCMLPFEEAVKWKQWRGEEPLEDMSLSLYDFCWQRAVSILHTGRYMRKLPHARSVSDVREDESGGKAVCDPEQRVVPFLPQTSRCLPAP